MAGITRREALAALAAYVGSQQGTITTTAIWKNEPGDLQFDLRAFRRYRFTEGDRTVTVTPKELMDAIAHAHSFADEGPVMFKLRDMEFDVCLSCGELARKPKA